MQRLTPIVEFGLPIMEPRDRGLYVLYDDAQATIARLTAELEAEKAKRAEAVDAETRACAEVVRSAIPSIPPDGPTNDECRIVYEELGGAMTAILARLDQRKEAGK